MSAGGEERAPVALLLCADGSTIVVYEWPATERPAALDAAVRDAADSVKGILAGVEKALSERYSAPTNDDAVGAEIDNLNATFRKMQERFVGPKVQPRLSDDYFAALDRLTEAVRAELLAATPTEAFQESPAPSHCASHSRDHREG